MKKASRTLTMILASLMLLSACSESGGNTETTPSGNGNQAETEKQSD